MRKKQFTVDAKSRATSSALTSVEGETTAIRYITHKKDSKSIVA